MNIEIDKDRVVSKLKRNGHQLNKSSLELLLDHLKEADNPHKHLDEIIKKVNEMSIIN